MWNFYLPKPINNQLDTISGQNVEIPYLTQTPVQEDIDRQIHDMDSIMKTQMICHKEDRFNGSIITLFSKTYKNNILDMNKNMDLPDWLLQLKSSCIDKESRIQISKS